MQEAKSPAAKIAATIISFRFFIIVSFERFIWVKLTFKKLKCDNYVYGIFTGYSSIKCFEMHSYRQIGVKILTYQITQN